MTGESGIPTFGPSERPVQRAAAERFTPRPDPAKLRISDQDRQVFVDQLTRHCAEGRLTFEELDERIAKTWTARTRQDLRPLNEDLPDLEPVKGPEPTVKQWLEDGRALVTTLPSRALVAGAAGLALVFMLLFLLAVPLGHYPPGR
jgi:hypothetical protein